MPIRLLICTLLLLLLAGLSGARPASSAGRRVLVQLTLGGAPLRLGGAAVRTAAGDEVTVTACRFYLSGLTLHFADSSTYHDPEMAHLIDAEEPGSWSLALPGASSQPVVAVSFSIGLDSAASQAGALGGPLDPVHGMYWAWQSGYINAKIEGTSLSRPAAARHQFAFHIGGYARPYPTRRTVRLAFAAPSTAESLTLLADVGRWLGAAPLAQTPDVVIPGGAAATHADRLAAMFRLDRDGFKKLISSTLPVDAPR
jgi:hypothetical protein